MRQLVLFSLISGLVIAPASYAVAESPPSFPYINAPYIEDGDASEIVAVLKEIGIQGVSENSADNAAKQDDLLVYTLRGRFQCFTVTYKSKLEATCYINRLGSADELQKVRATLAINGLSPGNKIFTLVE